MACKVCKVCEGTKPKHIPYGQPRSQGWCIGCDCNITPDEPKKKSMRQKHKKEVKEGLVEYDKEQSNKTS